MEDDRVTAQSAAAALAEVRAQQERMFADSPLPFWFWPATGAACVVLSAAVESRRTAVIAIAAVVFAVGIATIVLTVVFRQRFSPRPELLGVRGGLTLAGFVLATVALGLGTGFALYATGIAYPATIACALVMVALTAGGPWLTRRLQNLMRQAAQAGR